jgi:hypothetical protein
MSDKTKTRQSKQGNDTRRTELELVVVIVLFVAAITATVVTADSSEWDSSPTAVGTTVHW